MSKHTTEPWELLESEDDKDYLRIRGTVWGGRYKIANVLLPSYSESARERGYGETLANAERIIDCVNACAGMDDPAEEIAELKSKQDELVAENERLREALDAAKAVVVRWDTPNWKDAEPTAAVIGRLRDVISKCGGSAS